jgi:hypothetical protein
MAESKTNQPVKKKSRQGNGWEEWVSEVKVMHVRPSQLNLVDYHPGSP